MGDQESFETLQRPLVRGAAADRLGHAYKQQENHQVLPKPRLAGARLPAKDGSGYSLWPHGSSEGYAFLLWCRVDTSWTTHSQAHQPLASPRSQLGKARDVHKVTNSLQRSDKGVTNTGRKRA